LFLLLAHNFETAFLAAEDGVEETYNPCSLESTITVKWRLEDVIIYNINKVFGRTAGSSNKSW
jgi:hypothetical protein